MLYLSCKSWIPAFFAGLVLIGYAPRLQAAGTFPAPAVRDLHKAGLEKVDKPKVFKAESVAQGLSSADNGDILREGGALELHVDQYGGPAGPIRCETLQLQDSKAAYSGFTFSKPAKNAPLGIGDGAVEAPGLLLFWQADYLVRLSWPSGHGESHNAAQAVAESISRSIGEHQETPPLAQFLPSAGRVAGTERYLLGQAGLKRMLPGVQEDLVGFKDSSEVAVSDYTAGNESAKLLLIGYPTMALARQYYGTLVPKLQETDLQGQGYFTKRSGALIAVLVGHFSIENARQLLDKIEYSYSVKWIVRKEAPAASAALTESYSMLGTVVASILLTGIFCLVSLAGGIALGGTRFLMRKLAPNNYLDRPERVELLQLKLSKKIT